MLVVVIVCMVVRMGVIMVMAVGMIMMMIMGVSMRWSAAAGCAHIRSFRRYMGLWHDLSYVYGYLTNRFWPVMQWTDLCKLQLMQAIIVALHVHEFLMSSFLHLLGLMDNDDAVGILNRREAVGNDQ